MNHTSQTANQGQLFVIFAKGLLLKKIFFGMIKSVLFNFVKYKIIKIMKAYMERKG